MSPGRISASVTGGRVGDNDWLSRGQMSIPQPRIVAREVKSYNQKSASVRTPWLARVGEGRRVWSPQRRVSRIPVATRTIV